MSKIHVRANQPHRFSNALSPLLQRIFSARHLTTDEELDYRLQNLQAPASLKGLDDALDLFVQALKQQQRVLIVGDFDADGATSCAVSILGLKALGFKQVDFLVPNRFEYGYGLTSEIVEQARSHRPDLIVTVDNGIASIEGVAYARSLGIKVIVTDHHLAPEQLPEADAIVNPNQEGCLFPSKNLAGVGVIFYVLLALRTRLREAGWFEQPNRSEPNLAELLDLVALGTVADVVPLDYNNRILVQQGLQRIRSGRTRVGISALLQVAGKSQQRLTSQDLGFILGPRLNAAGRLDDMTVGINCLLTEDVNIARELASELDSLNRERRAIEASMQREALKFLDEMSLEATELPWGLSLFNSTWHQGVVGILASRIKDKYHRPVIAFAEVDNNTLKGSARSIPGLHIRDALDEVATRHPEILQKFGGHAMAAGLSITKEHFTAFCQYFDQVVREHLSENDLQQIIETDGELLPDEITMESARILETAGPWGQHFPEPSFQGVFKIIRQRLVGEKHLKLTLAHKDHPNHLLDGIAFNIDLAQWPNEALSEVLVVYQLGVNEYQGLENVQLVIRYLDGIA